MKTRSFGALNKLKSLYCLFLAIAAPLLFGGGAKTIAPGTSDLGCYYGLAQILKPDMPAFMSSAFELPYTGVDQEFIAISDNYLGDGTIYYKLGSDGTWSNEAPHFKSLGERDVYYYIVGDSNYSDLGSPTNPEHISVKVADWGRKTDNKETSNYVDKYGKTSAVVNKRGIIWINVGSDGNSSWYGLDNSNGIFETGSRFWVKLLDKNSSGQEYQKYFEQLDDVNKQKFKNGKLLIFLTGVTKPDGTVYTNLSTKVPYYIQLGKSWSGNEICALFVSSGVDGRVESQFNTGTYFKNRYGNLEFPDVASNYIRLVINRFAPFAVCERGNAENPSSNGEEVYGGNGNPVVLPQVSGQSVFGHFGDMDRRIGFVERLINSIIRNISPEDKSFDYGAENDFFIPECRVRFLILAEIIFILLLAVGIYIFKMYKRRKLSDNKNNKSL